MVPTAVRIDINQTENMNMYLNNWDGGGFGEPGMYNSLVRDNASSAMEAPIPDGAFVIAQLIVVLGGCHPLSKL